MIQRLKPIMFVGTGSDVGKSVINAAFCRIFKQDGYTPAPFKAQNMSLNSYATPDGLEIGRAQAVQAEACGVECRVEMNPVLLKPTSYKSSQVVLNGKPIGNNTASEYFLRTDRDWLFENAMKSFEKLDEGYNPIVVEGAGSISEVNLWDKDITNMRVAVEAGADTYLIADIDRGGVFASVYGTMELLPSEQKKRIKGVIINKFRGDIDLFAEGKKMLEDLAKVPIVGIIPYFRDIHIEQEDSVVIDHERGTSIEGKINVCVVLLPRMSNFTDFNMLRQQPEVHLYYSHKPEEIKKAEIAIIPGSKNTIEDMAFVNEQGIDKALHDMVKKGKQVYGVCGGFQMMGQKIKDPWHVEGDMEEIEALGILPVTTTLTSEKKTVQTRFQFLDLKKECSGYEIHMGETTALVDQHLCTTTDSKDGYFKDPKLWGTYIHGIFDNPVVVEYILRQVNPKIIVEFDYRAFKEKEYDRLAGLVRDSVDMEYIYKNLQS